jgi:hypothetical protein
MRGYGTLVARSFAFAKGISIGFLVHILCTERDPILHRANLDEGTGVEVRSLKIVNIHRRQHRIRC